MILVVDTNVLLGHAELDGRDWGEVKTAVAEKILTVVIPYVVADELTARVRANRLDTKPVAPQRKGFRRAPTHIADPVDAAYATANEMINQWAAGYDAHRVFAAAGFIVRPAPEASHEDLGYRAANRIRPFDNGGNGYRDTLHWYTVLELLRENQGEHVVFLSNDKSAYWERGQLHSQLSAEVEPFLVDETRFTLASTLSDISIPSKSASEEERVTLTAEERDELVAELFKAGVLESAELWNTVSELGDQVDAEISDPEDPSVVFAFARQIEGGGTAYRTRIRLNALIIFDWVDWIVDGDDTAGTRGDLDITTWYVRDKHDIRIDRTDVRLAPIETPPKTTAGNSLRTKAFTQQLIESIQTAAILREIKQQNIANSATKAFSAGFATDLTKSLNIVARAVHDAQILKDQQSAAMLQASFNPVAEAIRNMQLIKEQHRAAIAQAAGSASDVGARIAREQAASLGQRHDEIEPTDADAAEEDDDQSS